MNDFDTSFILNTDKGIRFKSIEKHPFTEPAPELVGWHAENRVGNWTDMFIAGILAYRLLNNFEYPEAFVNAKTGISDITERYFEYQRLFNSLAEGEAVIEPPANGSEELKAAILDTLQISPEKRSDANKVLNVISRDVDKTREYSGSSAGNDIGDGNSEIIKISSSKRRSHLLYTLYALPFVVFMGVLTFMIANQFHNGMDTAHEDEPPVVVAEESTVTDTSSGPTTEAYSEPATAAISTESSKATSEAATETAKTTTRTAKATQVKGRESESETEPDESPEPIATPSEEKTENTAEPQTEARSPFAYREAEIDGQGIFTSVSGLEIVGYYDESEMPSCIEIPETIDGQKVVSIADEAFCGCDIEEVVIPDSVVNIGERAFCNCPVLWKITLGKKVSMIGEQAFFNTQYSGSHDEREITVTNPSHMNCERFFGEQWDGREHDYVLIFDY
ncbi:MAG: leucine-rich repeat domain-containing protein [Ruminococcus sp.]|nr:leucine-rich repeat domain-containing protein [Ruminococcus sp.]